MSLLWRMGITSLPSLKGMDLGDHQEVLRDLLHKENPADSLTYPCMITAVMLDGKHAPDLILQCGEAKIEGPPVWRFVAAGFLFMFYISGKSLPAQMFLNRTGSTILLVNDIKDIGFLHRKLNKVATALRLRESKA